MKETIIALVIGGVGVAVLLAGYRIARVIIPLWGLIAGFMLGASAASDAFSSPFIGTLGGVIAGLIIGLVFAVFAYFFFELAIVLLGAEVGYWLGVGFVGFFGIQKGFLSAIIGILIGICFGLIALFGNLPKYYLIIISALAGSVSIITSLLLLLDKVKLDDLSYVATNQEVTPAWIWSAAILALVVAGVAFQLTSTKKFKLKQWRALGSTSTKSSNK